MKRIKKLFLVGAFLVSIANADNIYMNVPKNAKPEIVQAPPLGIKHYYNLDQDKFKDVELILTEDKKIFERVFYYNEYGSEIETKKNSAEPDAEKNKNHLYLWQGRFIGDDKLGDYKSSGLLQKIKAEQREWEFNELENGIIKSYKFPNKKKGIEIDVNNDGLADVVAVGNNININDYTRTIYMDVPSNAKLGQKIDSEYKKYEQFSVTNKNNADFAIMEFFYNKKDKERKRTYIYKGLLMEGEKLKDKNIWEGEFFKMVSLAHGALEYFKDAQHNALEIYTKISPIEELKAKEEKWINYDFGKIKVFKFKDNKAIQVDLNNDGIADKAILLSKDSEVEYKTSNNSLHLK